jgi:hypothetical protein
MIDDLFYDKKNWESGNPSHPSVAAFIYFIAEHQYKVIYLLRQKLGRWTSKIGNIHDLETMIGISRTVGIAVINAGKVHGMSDEEIESHLEYLGESYVELESNHRRETLMN